MTREQFDRYAATQLNTDGWSDEQLELINCMVYEVVADLDLGDDLTGDIVKSKFEDAFDSFTDQDR
jgi:hypothetical protein